MSSKILSLRSTVLIALFTALIAVGAYIAVPVGPVPIVLQNFFVLLAGTLLGSRKGLSVVVTYLVLGAIGLPVFHNGTGGMGIILGPTGGYLIGYIPAVVLTGLISKRKAGDTKSSALSILLGTLSGAVVVYLCGVPWLKYNLGMSWSKALSAGMIPFLIGDALKVAAVVPITRWLKPAIDSLENETS